MVKLTRNPCVISLGLLSSLCTLAPEIAAAQTLPTETPPPPPLVWQTCPDSPTRDCATLTVPLDYADLSKGYIDLPVARAPATGQRIGTLVVHLGAQGSTLVSEIKSPNLDSLFSPELQQRFDIVGINHRGTTEGIACLQTSAELEQYWEANHLARTIAEIDQLLAQARANPIPAPSGYYTQRPVNDWIMMLGIKFAFIVAGELGYSFIDQIIDASRNGDASRLRDIYDEQTGIPGQYFTGA